jgi:LAO/AO transport system kinase
VSTPAIDRRAVGRDLSRLLDAPVAEVLARLADAPAGAARRIGLTGSPGAGKSTLVAALAPARLARAETVAVLAVDPTSPVSGGSILGDRIRMDAVASHPRLYIRSVPSRSAHDGLCDNAPDLLLALEQHGFDEILLETVGVGQAEFQIRALVDTLVLVLQPETGDGIQAMKAGVLELADVVVVNKADLPGTEQLESALRETLGATRRGPGQWQPRVVPTAIDGRGIEKLDAAIEAHEEWARGRDGKAQAARQRRRYHLASLVGNRLGSRGR